MLNQYGLTKGWSVMDSRAAIGVTTCPYFEVEGTVYLKKIVRIDCLRMAIWILIAVTAVISNQVTAAMLFTVWYGTFQNFLN